MHEATASGGQQCSYLLVSKVALRRSTRRLCPLQTTHGTQGYRTEQEHRYATITW